VNRPGKLLKISSSKKKEPENVLKTVQVQMYNFGGNML
jgi:hypothetical protein